MKKSVWASVGLLFTAVIWGFAFVIVKNSLDFIGPIYMLAFRFSIAAVVLGMICSKRLMQMNKKTLIAGSILGFLLFLSYFFQTVGIQYTTAGKNAFLTTIYVVLVPFLNWILNKVKLDKKNVLAAFLAVIGIALLSLQGNLSMNIGDILTLICGFGFAFHIIYIDKFTEKQDPVVLTVLQFFIAAILSWIVAPIMDGGFPQGAFETEVVVGMLYLGLLSTMVAFFLQNVCQKYTTPDVASILLSLESVFGVLFSVIFLNERLTGRMILGCGLLFAAVILAQIKLQFLVKRKD